MCLHPLAWTNVSSEKNACFAIWAHVGTKFLNYVPSFPIYGWLAWWCDFFPVRATCEDHPQVFKQKNPAPCIFFWHLRLGLLKSPLYTFCGWWSWTCVSVPFCKDKCIPSKKHVFCNLGARWHKILEFVPSCPISGWLAWWCDFFSCGANLWRSPASIRAKRSSPFDFIFDTCASASWSHCFTLFRLVKLNTCACTLLQGQMYFHQKHVFSRAILARVDTKFLNSSHHVLSLDDWPDDATFFLWCQPLKIIRKYSAKKRSSLLDFIFDTCASASSNHFFGWWSWTRVSVPLCKDKYIFSKKTCVLQFGRALTHFFEFVPSCAIYGWSGDATFFLWGQPLKIIHK